MSLDIDLRQNCKLVCIYSPMVHDSISILDNANRFRCQLDGLDCTTRDLTYLSPAYNYINLMDNYGSLRDIARLKVDPSFTMSLDTNHTYNLNVIAQSTNNNNRMHVDVYDDGLNQGLPMTSKIVYVFQFLEVIS